MDDQVVIRLLQSIDHQFVVFVEALRSRRKVRIGEVEDSEKAAHGSLYARTVDAAEA
jgi:hypothetical protein